VNGLKDYFEYFRRNFIGVVDPKNGGWQKPKFSIVFWNARERVILNLPRTTNGVESWHRTLNKIGEIPHPNIGKFVEILQKNEEMARFTISKLISGQFNI
jgi:hypothetical protein